MSGYLTKIKTKIPFSNKNVDIEVNGKTLILTGGNGCGKTQLLSYVFEKLNDRVVRKNNTTIQQLRNNVSAYDQAIERDGPTNKSYDSWVSQKEADLKRIEELNNPPLELSDLESYILDYKELRGVLLQFEAGRKSDILKASSVSPIDDLREKDRKTLTGHQKTTSSIFEEFLITSIANQAFSESKKINNNPEEAERIDKWFKKLESDLQNLFEDEELKLVFKSDLSTSFSSTLLKALAHKGYLKRSAKAEPTGGIAYSYSHF